MIYFHRKTQTNYFSKQLKRLEKHNPEYGHHIGQRRGWFSIKTKFFEGSAPKNQAKVTQELNRHHARKLLCEKLTPVERSAAYFMLNTATSEITEDYVNSLRTLANKEKPNHSNAQDRTAPLPTPAPTPAETAADSEMEAPTSEPIELGADAISTGANKRPKQAGNLRARQETPKPHRTAQPRTGADSSGATA